MAVPSLIRKGVIILTILAVLAFALVVYGYVASNGVCCADDSTNAIVAKNLAAGKGYVNSIAFDGTPGLFPFDPQISTGPTLNVPAAALIRLFGNLPWVPGFTSATTSLLLLISIALVLWSRVGVYRASAYLLLLLCFLYNLTAVLHFEHWYSLLGEAPAALFCVSGAAVLARRPDRRTNIIFSGALYGLAALTKLLAVLAFVPVVLWLTWSLIIEGGNRRCRFVDLAEGGAAFLLPSILFEFWKLTSLGFGPYVSNLRAFVRLYAFGLISGARSVSDTGTTDPLHKAAAYSLAMYQHFGFSPLGLIVILLLISVLVFSFIQERSILLLYMWLGGGAAVLGSWWLFFSNGWPRYALIGLFLYFAAISCVVFAKLQWPILLGLTGLLLVCVGGSYQRLIEPVSFVWTNRYSQTERVRNLVRTAAYLKTIEESRPFVMGWWATAGDLEYVLPDVGNFVQSEHVRQEDRNEKLVLVRNTIWVEWAKDPAFALWERRCNKVLLNAPPYLVSECQVSSTIPK